MRRLFLERAVGERRKLAGGALVRGGVLAVVVVEPVCVKALRADSRVQVQLAASEPSALLDQPLQQRPGMTLMPCLGCGGEVIDVQVVAPGEVVANTESSDRDGRLAVWREDAEEPVADGSQHTVDVFNESLLAFIVHSQCAHRVVGEVGLAGRDLPSMCRFGLHLVKRIQG
jgi:hypothetical protein